MFVYLITYVCFFIRAIIHLYLCILLIISFIMPLIIYVFYSMLSIYYFILFYEHMYVFFPSLNIFIHGSLCHIHSRYCSFVCLVFPNSNDENWVNFLRCLDVMSASRCLNKTRSNIKMKKANWAKCFSVCKSKFIGRKLEIRRFIKKFVL